MSIPSDPAELKREVDQFDATECDDRDLIRMFGVYVAEATKDCETPPGPDKIAVRTARTFRDLLGVNILRILDRWGYQHPDGYLFRFDYSDKPESFFRRFDPVTEEERAPGGIADFRPGDIIEIADGWAVVIATNDYQMLAWTPNGPGLYPLATVRNIFEFDEYDARLIDGGRVIRGETDGQ